MPMHDSPRDQVLDAIVSMGWANQSDGNTEAPTGHFARVSILDRELDEVVDALKNQFVGGYVRELVDELDPKELIGHHLVRKMDSGNIYVESHSTEYAARCRYDGYLETYTDWAEQNEL